MADVELAARRSQLCHHLLHVSAVGRDTGLSHLWRLSLRLSPEAELPPFLVSTVPEALRVYMCEHAPHVYVWMSGANQFLSTLFLETVFLTEPGACQFQMKLSGR